MATTEVPDRLLTVDDVLDRLPVSRAHLNLMFQSGELPSVKVGKRRFVRESDLATYIAHL